MQPADMDLLGLCLRARKETENCLGVVYDSDPLSGHRQGKPLFVTGTEQGNERHLHVITVSKNDCKPQRKGHTF